MSEMSEQDGMGKCRKCRSKVGARWIGKMSEQSWSKVGKKMVYDTDELIGIFPTSCTNPPHHVIFFLQKHLNGVNNSDKLRNPALPSFGELFSLSTSGAENFIFVILRVLLQF